MIMDDHREIISFDKTSYLGSRLSPWDIELIIRTVLRMENMGVMQSDEWTKGYDFIIDLVQHDLSKFGFMDIMKDEYLWMRHESSRMKVIEHAVMQVMKVELKHRWELVQDKGFKDDDILLKVCGVEGEKE